MALNKEVWVEQILEGFYNENSFLKSVTDLSDYVDNNKLHIPEAGIDPKVLVDNNTYPIAVIERTDKDNIISLQRFETENTLVRHIEEVEYNYNKMESVIRQHRATLQNAVAMRALHAFAPMEHTTETPVLVTTGEITTDGRKRLTFEDILRLKEAFDIAKYPTDNRYLVLNPQHVTDLLLSDIKLFKDLTNIVNGEPIKFAGFGCYTFGDCPTYIQQSTKLEKQGFEVEEKSKLFSSVAFIKSEVMKADGEFTMFAREDDPEQRGSVIGFEKRFVALPIRNKGVGAIVSSIS